ncbi:hypothetical protein [Rhizobium sp. MHM7A]|uniref:hypothetical protein n=1 Tax=Rhizobium sp. MHM7A TaxID=2583233 RepID=UPI0011064156|nr:hypothetical protein [Rhizobium sp. MHM7A]TLX16668.1 hypothetical protein FFR93_04820 [Rhizobium sp. MHM7A]
MQTISIPYRCSSEDRTFIAAVQRVYSAAVRTGFANALDSKGNLVPEKALRELVKDRHAGDLIDAWSLHCATLEARDLHKSGQPQHMVFGGRKNLERRRKRLITRDEWKALRLRPFASRGDKSFGGNRHFKLSLDGTNCTFTMMEPQGDASSRKGMKWRKVHLDLAIMTGNAGEIICQAAMLASLKKINVMFRIDQKKLHITVDPVDLTAHPERRSSVRAVKGRAVGIDLNPESIGVSAVENTAAASDLKLTKLLDHFITETSAPGSTTNEVVREMLAKTCDRIIRLCRKWGAGVIAVEKGLGKLRSAGRSKDTNRKNNFWTRTVFVHMLMRKARLAGMEVVELWGGYSTTIGNIAFKAPDAAAAGAEMARRALARQAKIEETLPVFDGEIWDYLQKDFPSLEDFNDVTSWQGAHQAIKAAKIGYRRPHPEVLSPGPDDRGRRSASLGHAVLRLGHRGRPGLVFRPVTIQVQADSPVKRVYTRKSG